MRVDQVVPILNVSDVRGSFAWFGKLGWHARCLAEGLEVTYPPTDEPWGMREMPIRHPDGHVLRIGRAQR